jgi:hypothetical protein
MHDVLTMIPPDDRFEFMRMMRIMHKALEERLNLA